MKAAVISSPGSAPEYGEFDDPVADEGREIVELVATGIHPVVRAIANGTHYGSDAVWPSVPGIDAVARTSAGVHVYTGYVAPPYGTLAERISVPSAMHVALPEHANPIQIAAGLNPGLASWLPLQSRVSEIGKLGTVVVLGATGMAGLLAVQNALLSGADRVIGVGRSADGLSRTAAAGGLPVVLSGDQVADAESIRTALDGQDPCLVLDFVWGTPAEAAFHALGRRGLHEDSADISYVQIGAVAGAEARVPAALLRSRKLKISGSGAGSAAVAKIAEQLPAYMRIIADGRVRIPTIVFSLSEVAKAWAAAATTGSRVVVVPH